MNIGQNTSLVQLLNGNSLYDYLLVAYPDTSVCNKVLEEKQQFCNNYGERIETKTKPYIRVANFQASEAMESTIVRWMQRIYGALESFEVTLNNYSGIPPHTIYLRVQNPQPFVQLTGHLQPVNDFIRSSACPPAKLYTNPYLSIARKLPEQLYNKAIAGYSQKTFHESFMLEELLLLRRQHEYDNYKTIQIFRLKPADLQKFKDVA